MTTQLPVCIPPTIGCTGIVPCFPPQTSFPYCVEPTTTVMHTHIGCTIGPTGVQYCTHVPAQCGATHWVGCPPVVGPTGVQGCTHSPAQCGHTAWYGCPTAAAPVANVAAPAAAAAVTIGPTGVQGCTQSPAQCGNTAWHGCPPVIGPTGYQGCTQAYCPPPAQGAAQVAANTAATVCTQIQCHPIGPTGVQGCTQSPAQCGHTAWHGCPPVVGPTGTQGCTQTAATVCTQIHCPPPAQGTAQTAANTAATVCTQYNCVHPTVTAATQCGHPQGTAATVCTQYQCVHPTLWTQIQCNTPVQHPTQTAVTGHTLGIACTQIACNLPTHVLGCTCMPLTVGPVMTVIC